MDGAQIARRRLLAQHLAGPPLTDPVAVVRHFGAIQAQEYPLARWSIGQRCAGFDDAAVHQAVEAAEIVRLHALRPTWHFVAASDVGWLQAATGPRVHAANAFYYRRHGLDQAIVGRAGRAVVAALSDGRHLTRAELGATLTAEGIEMAEGNKLVYLLMLSELSGEVVNGPMRGKQYTYALASERLHGAWTPEDGLAELARRYFTSHGPATVKDFAWWSSLTVTQARRALSMVDLHRYDVGGVHFYGPPGEDAPPDPGVRILQVYDEYVVAYSESRSLCNLAGLDLGPNTLVNAIVQDGQMIGAWRRTVERGTLVIRPIVRGRLSATLRRSIEAAFAEMAGFSGLPLSLLWS